MATDDVNIAEDAEMAECDGDKVVTMVDVLQEQQDFEEDANAVLGASDDKNCTYPKGYIKRQALYACLTCCFEAKVDPTKRAGVCLACSLTCHENHELIELYTKRNFRCDCGNPKFNSHPCQFTSDKTELNDDNIYNQNFSGLYCTCQRPYPDPDSTIEDDMIQCIICEDWLHASHLEAVVPANDQYSEMVCKSCMEKNEFLHDYSMFAVTVEAGDVDILTVNGDTKSVDASLCNGDLEKEKLINGVEENNTEIEPKIVNVNGDVEMEEAKDKSNDKVNDETDSKQDEESLSSETKQDELSSTTESTELKPEENAKPNSDDSKKDLSELEENSIDATENKEENEDATEKSDATESTPIPDEKPAEQNETIENEKIESIDNEPEKADETKKQTETQEQISELSTKEVDDNEQENKTETNDRTEEQLLDDLDALTSDNITSENKTDTAAEDKAETAAEDKAETAVEEKQTESMDESEDSKEKDEVEANKEESPSENANESGDKSEDKPAIENESATGNLEVPDTSQTEKDEKQNDEGKSDSVMDAIDELLQTANEAKEKESSEETKEPTSESSESKETTENVESKESEDVEMSASENKVPEVAEKGDEIADSTDKPTANTDIAMETQNETASESIVEPTTNTDIAIENEPTSESKDEPATNSDIGMENEPTSESKDDPTTNPDIAMGNEPTSEGKDEPTSESKDEPTTNSDIAMETEPTSENKNEPTTNSDIAMENEPTSESKDEPSTNSEITEEKSEVNDSISQDDVALKTDDKLETLNETDSESKTSNDNDSTNKTEPPKDEVSSITETQNGKEHKRKLSTDATDDSSPKKLKLECVRPKNVKRIHKGATFWPSNFRQKLCTCGECLSMYKDLKVLFLTDLEDTVFAYESLGKENVAGGASQYEKGMQALSSLDRIQQINALTEYNRMRDKLLDFLKSFKDRKEIVKEEDIKAFFAGMKPRREPDGVYFCR